MRLLESDQFKTIVESQSFVATPRPLTAEQQTKIVEWVEAAYPSFNYEIKVKDSFDYSFNDSHATIIDFAISQWCRLPKDVDWTAPAKLFYVPEGVEFDAFRQIIWHRLQFNLAFDEYLVGPIDLESIEIIGVTKSQAKALLGDGMEKYRVWYCLRQENMVPEQWEFMQACKTDNPPPYESVEEQWLSQSHDHLDVSKHDRRIVMTKLGKTVD